MNINNQEQLSPFPARSDYMRGFYYGARQATGIDPIAFQKFNLQLGELLCLVKNTPNDIVVNQFIEKGMASMFKPVEQGRLSNG